MKRISIILIGLLLTFFAGTISAQQAGAPPLNQGPVNKKQAKADKKKEEQKKKEEKAHQKALDRHLKIQTKDTRKRMKASKKKSKRLNENKREFFMVRWFKRKK